ncbi:hypothetical protein ES706_05672 [subsurface metagenome]
MSNNIRILYLGNNRVGFEVLKFLKQKNENIIGLILHPDSRARFKSEMIGLFPDIPKFGGDHNLINFLHKLI